MFHLLQAVVLAAFPCLLIVAALRDLVSFTIPNWMSAAAAAAFAPAALVTGLGWHAVGLHAVVGLVAFFVAVAMFALRWIGGGDAKLMAAAGLWLGWPASITFIVATGAAGGLLAMSLLAMRTDWVRAHVPSAAPPWAARLMVQGGPVPYGVAIAAGALLAFPASDLVGAAQGFL